MKLPAAFIPAAVLACALLCIPLREAFVYPAASITFDEAGPAGGAPARQVEMIVQGVKCQGTAEFFVKRYENQAGILGLEAFAADHKVVVTYDPAKTDPDRIRAIGDAPVLLENGELRTFFVVEQVRDR
jgi:hypothetical protein